jgi:hypothetical protein
MKYVQLLTVEDSFQITGQGLLVVPHLPPPRNIGVKPFRRRVRVEQPDGTMLEQEAFFALIHLSLTGGGSKWATVVMFPTASKQDVPVGSRIWVDAETLAALPPKE